MMFRMGEQKDGVSRKESFVFSDSVTIKQFNVKRREDGCAMGRILVIQRVRTAGEFV
jgi:hypothetical protein